MNNASLPPRSGQAYPQRSSGEGDPGSEAQKRRRLVRRVVLGAVIVVVLVTLVVLLVRTDPTKETLTQREAEYLLIGERDLGFTDSPYTTQTTQGDQDWASWVDPFLVDESGSGFPSATFVRNPSAWTGDLVNLDDTNAQECVEALETSYRDRGLETDFAARTPEAVSWVAGELTEEDYADEGYKAFVLALSSREAPLGATMDVVRNLYDACDGAELQGPDWTEWATSGEHRGFEYIYYEWADVEDGNERRFGNGLAFLEHGKNLVEVSFRGEDEHEFLGLLDAQANRIEAGL